jgi:hypothetical protein
LSDVQPAQKIVDLDSIEYPQKVLLYLRKRLDPFHVECFIKVAKAHKDGGLLITKIDNYNSNRKRYEVAYNALEKQGFIDQIKVANTRPLVMTVRGEQLLYLLKEERTNK